jgi:hypothetical protein
MQFLASIGNAFLRLKSVQPLCQNVPPFFTFYQTGCKIITWDIQYPIILFWIDFFSFHISDQRKEAKERRLIRTPILRYCD